ncbi:NADPH:quinone reductase-like Zn-dependent oxidoreductase [Haloactinopolyspora alba]|uniref:NADPH:quinone reductase-like Zn-dependent oxidoreductase n=1 Tax=Haloactinopolyspora alba TaxID=648780 RepID=A0A2P8E556_9ACTN|nr:NADP-dependent oxidoreductase [Haloactinopolyspora alba]PSL04601.1 NADPH:quinone reductase-like Zn-dependent oxidoreductase [Haloactinopolyspora alba]
MRAVAFTDFDQSAALLDVPAPEPGPGEVVVRVSHSSVNGFDLGVLGGFLQGAYEYEFPVVLGKDFAGVVTGVGQDVSEQSVGDEVFGVVMRPTLGQGGLAEYVAVPAGYGVATRPAGLEPEGAAALALAGTAAANAVTAADPGPGDTVLVCGATGGVGAMAVQLAAARGARVIATARPGHETEFVTGLGATGVVDYTGLDAAVRDVAPRGVEVALHLAGVGENVAELVADGGRFVSTVHHVPADSDERGVAVSTIMADPTRDTLDRLAGEVIAGRLRVPVTARYSLAQAPQALADLRAGSLGKLAITVAH